MWWAIVIFIVFLYAAVMSLGFYVFVMSIIQRVRDWRKSKLLVSEFEEWWRGKQR